MRVAQLGAGRIGAMHARLLAELLDPENLVVADVDRQRAERVAAGVGARGTLESPSPPTGDAAPRT